MAWILHGKATGPYLSLRSIKSGNAYRTKRNKDNRAKRQTRTPDGSKPLPSQLARNTIVGQFARRLVQQWLLNARKLALI